MNLPIVLYKYETRSLTEREHRPIVFESMLLISGRKKKKLAEKIDTV
jgi:hypothetical protein